MNNKKLTAETTLLLTQYMESVDELKWENSKYKLISDYMFLRTMLESANHNYRNVAAGEQTIITDQQYDYYEKLLERMEEANPEIKEFFNKYLGKVSITERVG